MNKDLRSVAMALRRLSPVVVDVPAGVRGKLLQRYMEASLRNGRMSLLTFAILAFGLGHEAPLAPRIAAFAALGVVYLGREWRARVMQRRFDPADPRSDHLYDLLVVVGSSFWGFAPLLLQAHVSTQNLYGALYVGLVAISVLSITYLAALPMCMTVSAACIVPLAVCLALPGTLQSALLALGSLMAAVYMLQRVTGAHDILLQALASESQNALLVQELQTYRRVLETENASLGSSLRDASHAASRDALTNLYNRRHLASFAAPLGEAVATHREEVSVCLLDIDHFKKFNDRHGHPVGDEVLRAVAGLLGARLRDFDCLARYGGEEFVIVLRRCDIGRGRRVAEVLRRNVAEAEIDTEVGPLSVTISVGVAQWSSGEALDDVLHRADRALYRAKQGGRDRVELDADDALRVMTRDGETSAPGRLH